MAIDREQAVELLRGLHAAQNAFYGGGDKGAVRALLAPDVVWTVPGSSAIAGTHRGRDAVLAYFVQRRDLARGTFRMHRRDVLVGRGNAFAALTDGTALITGVAHAWSTVGLYELDAFARIAVCHLLPLDPSSFDAIWAGRAA